MYVLVERLVVTNSHDLNNVMNTAISNLYTYADKFQFHHNTPKHPCFRKYGSLTVGLSIADGVKQITTYFSNIFNSTVSPFLILIKKPHCLPVWIGNRQQK